MSETNRGFLVDGVLSTQVACPNCGGGELAGVVTHDMATDAGEPEMEGQGVPCATCGGDGWLLEPVASEASADSRVNPTMVGSSDSGSVGASEVEPEGECKHDWGFGSTCRLCGVEWNVVTAPREDAGAGKVDAEDLLDRFCILRSRGFHDPSVSEDEMNYFVRLKQHIIDALASQPDDIPPLT